MRTSECGGKREGKSRDVREAEIISGYRFCIGLLPSLLVDSMCSLGRQPTFFEQFRQLHKALTGLEADASIKANGFPI
jgi:hypothetical protein